MQFFTSPEDLKGWVKSQPTANDAAAKIMDLFKDEKISENTDIAETCKEIYQEEDGDASNILFGALAKRNITKVKGAKEMSKITKVAQNAVQPRQRNNWVRGNRNKFNRVVDGFNEGTPWRTERNRYYDFTHYYTDALSFDTDPNHVYSGEAIWRMYIMDKFTPDYQDKDGRVVGGYINDRFHRFPTAGTPANPDVDRLQGNQMELAAGERTRKPRPHQYSIERRMEEARGNETYDLEAVVANAKSVVKLASTHNKEKDEDKIYSVFKDTLDMREAGIEYPTMLEAISEHYDIGIMHVAQIDKEAQKLKAKHEGIMYVKEAQIAMPNLEEKVIVNPNGVATMDGKTIPTGYKLSQDMGSTDIYTVKDPQGNVLEKVRIPSILDEDVTPIDVQEAAAETGLLEDSSQTPESQNFPVQDVTHN